jgi:hypothetical protein
LQSSGARPTVTLVVGEQGMKIPVKRMTRAGDFAALDAVTLLHFRVIGDNPGARAIATELESYLIERTDGLSNLSESERRASDEAAFEFVRRLEEVGYVVCAGVNQAELRFDDDPGKTRAWHMGCVAVSSIEDEAPFAIVSNE